MSISYTNNTNSTEEVLPLELSEVIKKEGIVDSFVFDKRSNCIVAALNHKYDRKTIVSTVYNDWLQTIKWFSERAKKKGIEKKYVDMLTDVLDDNWQAVMLEGDQKQQDDDEGEGGRQPAAEERGEKEEDFRPISEKALDLVQGNCSELFTDQFGSPYAAIKIGEHIEILPLKSPRFKNWLCKIYYDTEDHGVLNNENVTNVLNILKARAEFEGSTKSLHLRVASVVADKPDTIYYDLTNKPWESVQITAEHGWDIVYSPTIFRRYSGQLPQVYASKEYPQDVFDRFMDLVNVTDYDNKLLLKCYIISLFIADIPKPVLMLHGEQGSAKSTLQELIRMLVDPSSIKTVTFPRDITELVQKLMHNYICYFDNVSKIPEWISDQLCRAVTGSGFSKRELYTDDDDIIYNFKRCIGFNGINLGSTKADLLDRGIIVELERIPKERMVRLEVIWQEFEKLKPQLLGYVFDILVKILQVKRNGGIEINSYPRMADFAEAGEIISRCMGYQDGAFLRVYYKNIDLQVGEAIEANPVGNAIVKFMEDKDEWSGTSTELLSELESIADSLKIDTRSKLWPKAPNSLSRRINEIKTNLRQIGVEINRYVTDQNIKGIAIRKISKISPDRQNDKNQAQVASDTSGDITKYTGNISTEENNISPDKNPENYAQSDVSGDISDSGDIIRTCRQQPSSNNNTAKSTIYRLGQSDTWACYNCRIRADKWFMQKHDCSGSRK